MNAAEPVRADVLIREARERAHAYTGGPEADRLWRLADALEAATGGGHIDAKHWAEVGRLRARVAELEAKRADVWSEGFTVGERYAMADDWAEYPENPYRQAEGNRHGCE